MWPPRYRPRGQKALVGGINMYLSPLERLVDQPERAKDMKKILASTKNASAKIEGVIKRVLDFARPSHPQAGLDEPQPGHRDGRRPGLGEPAQGWHQLGALPGRGHAPMLR
ncbi:hypothetical protein DFAR_3240006 [Desulfarculales bacterium]